MARRTAAFILLASLSFVVVLVQHASVFGRLALAIDVDGASPPETERPAGRNATAPVDGVGATDATFVIGVDNYGAIARWDEAAHRLTGLRPEEVLRRSLIDDLLADPRYADAVRPVLGKAMSGIDTTGFRFPLKTKGGGRLDVMLNATRWTDDGGRIRGVLGVGRADDAGGGVARAPPVIVPGVRNSCSLVRIDRTGNVTVVRPSRGWRASDPYQAVFDYFVERVESAVAELGPLRMDADSLLFEVSTPDLPNCGGGPLRGTTCEEMLARGDPRGSSRCCGGDGEREGRSLPLIGHARNVCCPCSLVLPISRPQMPRALNDFLEFDDPHPWEEKESTAVWHGSRTGHPSHVRFYTDYFRHVSKQPNGTLLSKNIRGSSLEWNPGPIQGVAPKPRDRIVSISRDNPTMLEASYGSLPWVEIVKHKYIVAVSGHTWASLLKPALLSRSCVIKQDPIATEWFEEHLVEWVHYVPVLYDLSDLLEKIRWAMANDEHCRRIGENGRSFALRHLSGAAVNSWVHKSLSNEQHTYNWTVD